jgi:hypothetical protein
VWRENWQVYYQALAPGEARVLRMTVSNNDFASICEVLAEELQFDRGEADLVLKINQMMTRWVRQGLLTPD